MGHPRLEKYLSSVEELCGPFFARDLPLPNEETFNAEIAKLVDLSMSDTPKDLSALLGISPSDIDAARDNLVIPRAWFRHLKLLLFE